MQKRKLIMKTLLNEEKIDTQQTGRYGNNFGGQYIPEILMSELEKVNQSFQTLKDDPTFKMELQDLLIN